MKNLAYLGLIALGLAGSPVVAQTIDFGNDSSEWANDGECDDARFAGPGMTGTPLLQVDVMADATDCRSAYQSGQLMVRGVSNGLVDFGDDSGDWANDGECEDMRFEGPGMTGTPLLEDDVMRDASDCKSAYDAGRLQLVGISR